MKTFMHPDDLALLGDHSGKLNYLTQTAKLVRLRVQQANFYVVSFAAS